MSKKKSPKSKGGGQPKFVRKSGGNPNPSTAFGFNNKTTRPGATARVALVANGSNMLTLRQRTVVLSACKMKHATLAKARVSGTSIPG
jgi:hypothetical protein